MIDLKGTVASLLTSLVGGALGGLLGYYLVDREHITVPAVVRSERFELLGIDGKVRAYWGNNKDGDLVTAYVDSLGRARMEFGVSRDNATQWITMYGPDGSVRVRLGTDVFSQSSLALGDEHQETRILLGSLPGDLPVRSASWGLVLPKKGTFSSWIDIGVYEDVHRRTMSPTIAIGSASGARWTAPVGK